jgi:type IV secretory pathway component VirB8
MNVPVKPPGNDDLKDEYQPMAEKIRSGEYFEESRQIYDVLVHDPMAERYFYILITGIAALIFIIAVVAMRSLYPLNTPVPFIFETADIVEDLPHMRTLQLVKGEDPSESVLRFIVGNYVTLREEYNIGTFDRNISGVTNQSTEDVATEYRQAIDPRNPESPITLYQRHSIRKIAILSDKRLLDQDFGMEMVFEATVSGKGEIKKSRWQANVAFQYSGVTLDKATGEVKALSFVVTKYQTKRLQDAR